MNLVPTEADFDPVGGCLDAQCAWGNFGGLSLDAAYRRFCEHPDLYQEDFMFMGGAAFAYYFPVIERYIRESHAYVNPEIDVEIDVEAMWILALCIKNHIEDSQVNPLRLRIDNLIQYVRTHLSQYCTEIEEQRHVDSAWAELQATLSAS
jgi:hypothetical protein